MCLFLLVKTHCHMCHLDAPTASAANLCPKSSHVITVTSLHGKSGLQRGKLQTCNSFERLGFVGILLKMKPLSRLSLSTAPNSRKGQER